MWRGREVHPPTEMELKYDWGEWSLVSSSSKARATASCRGVGHAYTQFWCTTYNNILTSLPYIQKEDLPQIKIDKKTVLWIQIRMEQHWLSSSGSGSALGRVRNLTVVNNKMISSLLTRFLYLRMYVLCDLLATSIFFHIKVFALKNPYPHWDNKWSGSGAALKQIRIQD